MCGFLGIIAPAGGTKKAFTEGLAAIAARGTTVDTLETGAERYGYTGRQDRSDDRSHDHQPDWNEHRDVV